MMIEVTLSRFLYIFRRCGMVAL